MTPSTGMELNFPMGSSSVSSHMSSYPDPTLAQINTDGAFIPGRVGGLGYRKPSFPFLVIVEQPKPRGLRFRYECEGRSAGAIPGENSTPENRIYPTVKIENMDAPSAVIVVSCVSKEDPARPHPHSLTGQNCQKGVCTVKLTNTDTISFRNLGIQCVKKKGVEASLAVRATVKVDPFSRGYSEKNHDLTTVRLCFQAFLPDQNGKFCRIVKPIVSNCIYDKKAVSELVICRISKQAGSVHGGDQVFIFTEKIQKDNITVRFFEQSEDGLVWEAFADFGQGDVHRQFAIVIRTPPYRNTRIRQPVTVLFQLRRPSDGEVSEAKPFQYIPEDPDPDGLDRKKRKLNFSEYFNDGMSPGVNPSTAAPAAGCVGDTVKDRLKAKVSRKNKLASTMTIDSVYPGDGPVTSLPQYSFNNTGAIAMPQADMYSVSATETMMAANQIVDPLQSVMNATINCTNITTLDASQLDLAHLPNVDMSSIDSNFAHYLVDSLQPSGDSFGSMPSFPETESGLQGDLVNMFHDPNIGANEVIPPK